MIQPEIVYEDEGLLAIVKPPGMVVNRADTAGEETLQDWVEARYGIVNSAEGSQAEKEAFKSRSGIAHRLDKETSGVLVIGKTPVSLAELMRQFRERETEKVYMALTHGVVGPLETTIHLPIKRSQDNRHKFRVDVDGKPATTGYQVEKVWPSRTEDEWYADGFSLVKLFPKTGRTHQIRVHMAHVGYPLVADELYAGRKRTERDRSWCPRHFLHAAALRITHPGTGEPLLLEAPLPADLRQAVDWLDQRWGI
jgi:23S rRNA pseudouridine1911/1915/1917 synthase